MLLPINHNTTPDTLPPSLYPPTYDGHYGPPSMPNRPTTDRTLHHSRDFLRLVPRGTHVAGDTACVAAGLSDFSSLQLPARRAVASPRQLGVATAYAGATDMIVRSGVFTPFKQLQVWVRRPPTHAIKANRHHYRPKDAYGPTWSNLGSSYVKLTFGHSTRGALRSGRGMVFTQLPGCESHIHFHNPRQSKYV